LLFTRGKNRFYEKMMQEVPGFHKDKTGGGSDTHFKYKFADVDCIYCDERNACVHEHCPHIMENLTDLIADEDFLLAVETAEDCKTAQKNTLLMLRMKCEGAVD
jgi:hypothetical protein